METGNIKMVEGAADGAFINPNGLAFNHDKTKLFITNRGFRAPMQMVVGLSTHLMSQRAVSPNLRFSHMLTLGFRMESKQTRIEESMGLLQDL